MFKVSMGMLVLVVAFINAYLAGKALDDGRKGKALQYALFSLISALIATM